MGRHSREPSGKPDNYVKSQMCVYCKVGTLERVFLSARRQISWDHFSKAQRKNISAWKDQLAVSHFALKYVYCAELMYILMSSNDKCQIKLRLIFSQRLI